MGSLVIGTSVPNEKTPFPPDPASSIDWYNLGVGRLRPVNGHIESTWTVDTRQWSEPRFVGSPTLQINGLASALNYGVQAYEGMKAVRDPSGQIRLFRPDLHAARMEHSCECVSIPAIPREHFKRCVSIAIALNAEFVPPSEAPASLYVRPLAFGSGPQLNIIPPEEFTFCVFVLPTAGLLGHAEPISALVLEDFDRAAPRGTGTAKIGGNYAPVMRWQKKAKEEGFGITLHLDSKTQSEIDEFSAAAFLGVKRNPDEDSAKYTLVVPKSNSIIKSVTSETCVEVAKSRGWKIENRSVRYDELRDFDEVLAAGTAAVIVPIKSITRKSRNETISYERNGIQVKNANTCFKILFHKILDIQRGIGEDSEKWSVVIRSSNFYEFNQVTGN